MTKVDVIFYKTDGKLLFDEFRFTTSIEDAKIFIAQFAKTHPEGRFMLRKHCYRYVKDGITSTMLYLNKK